MGLSNILKIVEATALGVGMQVLGDGTFPAPMPVYGIQQISVPAAGS